MSLLSRTIVSMSSRTTPDKVLHVGEGGCPKRSGMETENEGRRKNTQMREMGKMGHRNCLPSGVRLVEIYIAVNATNNESVTSDESSSYSTE
jgi:hypothetical protein